MIFPVSASRERTKKERRKRITIRRREKAWITIEKATRNRENSHWRRKKKANRERGGVVVKCIS